MVRHRDIQRRRVKRRVKRVIGIVLLAAAALVAIGPSLVPSGYLADRVRDALEAATGRTVHVAGCRLGWFSGLRVEELAIGPRRADAAAGGQAAESPVRIQGLRFQWQPWEMPEALSTDPPDLGRVTIDQLILHVVRGPDGRLNLPELSAGRPPGLKGLEVLDGHAMWIDQASGTRRSVSGLRLSFGRIEGTGKVRLSVGGRLLFPSPEGTTRTGLVGVSGLLDRVDLEHPERIRGGCDVLWENVDLAYLAPGVLDTEAVLSAATSGQASLTLGDSGIVNFELAISAPTFLLRETEARARIKGPALSVTGTFDPRTGQAVLEPAQIQGAGSSVAVSGKLTIDPQRGAKGDLTLDGTLNWGPLKREVGAVGRALGQLTSAAGTARLEAFHIDVDGTAATFNGTIDLSRTELALQGFFRKPADRPTTVHLSGVADLAAPRVDLAEARLLVAATAPGARGDGDADVELTARTIRRGQTDPSGHRAEGDLLHVDLRVPELARLPRYMPPAAAALDAIGASGPLSVVATVDIWSPEHGVAARIDATKMTLREGPGAGKPAGVPMTFDLSGRLGSLGTPAALTDLVAEFGPSEVTWSGQVRPAVRMGRSGALDLSPALFFDGHFKARGTEQWFGLVRHLLPEQPHVGIVGNLEGTLRGELDATTFRTNADIDATLATLDVRADAGRVAAGQRLLSKPLGKPTRITLNAAYDAAVGSDDDDRFEVDADVTIDRTRARLAARNVRGIGRMLGGTVPAMPRSFQATVDISSEDVGPMISYLPAAAAALEPYGVSGAAQCRLACNADAEQATLRLDADLTGTRYTTPQGPFALTKTPGLRQVLSLQARVPRAATDGSAVIEIEQASAEVGPCVLEAQGRFGLDADLLRAGPWPVLDPRLVRSVDLDATLTARQDASLSAFSRWWRDLSDRTNFVGEASGTLRLSGTREGGELRLGIDATEAGFQYGEGTRKPVGVRAGAEMLLRTAEVAGQIELAEAMLQIADTQVDCRGTVHWSGTPADLLSEIPDFAMQIECRSDQLARLAQLAPTEAARQTDLRGGLAFQVDVARDQYGLEVDNGTFVFRGTQLGWHGADLVLDGRVEVNRNRFVAERLRAALGDSSLTLVAEVARPLSAPDGQLTVAGPRLDLDSLFRTIAHADGAPADDGLIEVVDLATDSAEAATGPEDTPGAAGIPAEWGAVSDYLSRADLRGRLAFDRFSFSDDLGVRYNWDAFACDVAIADGRVDVTNLKAVMLGGVVNGRVGIDLSEPNPVMSIEYSARNLAGGPQIQPLIEVLFPDMTVTGKVTQVQQVTQRMFTTAGQPNHPVGVSLFAATKGKLTGPGAPEWLTNLLPGLKLTTYAFEKMESVSRLQADGRADNLMLFDGSPYAIYIDGYTLADGTADYTLGVDLFNSIERGEGFQRLEQGWVPLMRYSGRIADSRWQQREVEFKLPHEVAYEVFLKRNLLTKLLQKRGETRRPNFDPYDFDQPPAPEE